MAPSAGQARRQPGIGAMHALIFPHEPTECAVLGYVLIEPDQIVVVPRQIRHGLIGVVEDSFAERIAVPFEARDFAGLAADAGRDIDQLARRRNRARYRAREQVPAWPEIALISQWSVAHQPFSSFTRNPLNSGVYAFGSVAVGESELVSDSAEVLPASS